VGTQLRLAPPASKEAVRWQCAPYKPPSESAASAALAHLRQRQHFTADGDLAFAGRLGGLLDSNEVRRVYRKALEDAGLRRLCFHDMRHTFGTRAVEKAESILELKEWKRMLAMTRTRSQRHSVLEPSDCTYSRSGCQQRSRRYRRNTAVPPRGCACHSRSLGHEPHKL
jgi:hypothetical protein